MQKKFRRSLILAVAASALCGGLALALYQARMPQTPIDKLLSRSLIRPSGEPLPLAAWRGKPSLINFWGTWCPPCREEMPLLNAAAQAHPGVAFLGIAVDTQAAVAEYLREHPTAYPLAVADYAILEMTPQLGNASRSLPFTLLVDAKGKVLKQHQGALSAAELAAWLKPFAQPH